MSLSIILSVLTQADYFQKVLSIQIQDKACGLSKVLFYSMLLSATEPEILIILKVLTVNLHFLKMQYLKIMFPS